MRYGTTTPTRAARLRARRRKLASHTQQLRITSRGDGRLQRLSLPDVDDQWKQRNLRKMAGSK